MTVYVVDGLKQDCGNSSVLAVELAQFYTEPLMWYFFFKSFLWATHKDRKPVLMKVLSVNKLLFKSIDLARNSNSGCAN